MGELICLFPVRGPQKARPSLCLNYRPLGYEQKSWIYGVAPAVCGGCAGYLPDQGRCGKLPFRRECVCTGCGGFSLDRPGAACEECGWKLTAIAAPSDW